MIDARENKKRDATQKVCPRKFLTSTDVAEKYPLSLEFNLKHLACKIYLFVIGDYTNI